MTDEEKARLAELGLVTPEPPPLPPSVTAAVHVTLSYGGQTYAYDQDFEAETLDTALTMAEWQYANGNYACDCNRSFFIADYCDEEFALLACGQTITLVALSHDGRPLALDREGLG